MKITCADCGCVVDRGLVIERCAKADCCCRDLPDAPLARARDRSLPLSDTDTSPADPAHSYEVTAITTGAGTGAIHTKGTVLRFDSSPRQGDELPGPADLVTAAFAACIIKNVERMSEILPFSFRSASVQVHAERQDQPPRITRIRYAIELDTDEPDHRVALLHRNIARHGTIFNTLASACDVSGTIAAVPREDRPSPAG